MCVNAFFACTSDIMINPVKMSELMQKKPKNKT